MDPADALSGLEEKTCDYLSVKFRPVNGMADCMVLELIGSIDSFNSNSLHRQIMRVVDAGFIRLIFSLSRVDYISSTGVGTLVSLLRTVAEKGGNLALVKMQPKVASIFRLMCLDNFFSCSESVEDALKRARPAGVGPVFPFHFACPICDKRLVASKTGRFRCPTCKSILAVGSAGEVSLG